MNASTAVRADRADAGQLKDLLALHEAALANMSHGLCMVDAGQRLALVNQRFIELFEVPADKIYVGMPMRETSTNPAASAPSNAGPCGAVRRLSVGTRSIPWRR